MIDQIEFCDVLLLNKCDMVAEEELVSALGRACCTSAATGKLIRTRNGQVDPNEILNTGLFDFDAASTAAGWMKDMRSRYILRETEGDTASPSFVYERIRPFHPEAFNELDERVADRGCPCKRNHVASYRNHLDKT